MADITIVGGGASGIFCAIEFASRGDNVCLLEKNDRVGKKLLCTGNGKCNLTNINAGVENYNTSDIAYILHKYSPKVVIKRFEELGLLTRVDEEGRVYPYSESATTVLNILLQKLKEFNVKVVCDCEVKSIDYKDKKWIANTSKGVFVSDKLVLATGSDATMGQNSHKLVNSLGINSNALCYAICPLLTNEIKGANGVRAKVLASIVVDGKNLMQERGELLFKDNALSGVLAFRLSSMLARERDYKNCQVVIDFVPDMSQEQLAEHIFNYSSIFNPLEGILHKALAQNVMSRVIMDRSLLMSPVKANNIAKACKNFVVNITGLGGKSTAQVANGGLQLDNFDMKTMQSKKYKGLYCIGEVVDVDGLCGGYNLQWAWASAMACAGEE